MNIDRLLPARLGAAVLIAALTACAGSPAVAPAPAPAAHAIAPGATAPEITPADLRHRLEIIAHDSMEGRDTGSRGLRLTAEYIASEMERLGLRPAGDRGTYFHDVPLDRIDYRFSAALDGADVARTYVVPISGIGGLPGNARPAGEGPVIFGGYMVDPTIAAADDLTPADFEGATVVVRFGAAPGVTGGQPRLPLPMLIGPGARASAVILVAEGDLAEFWSYASGIARRGNVVRSGEAAQTGGGGPAVFLVSPEGAERLLGRPLEGARAPIKGLGTFRYELAETRSPVEAFNVVAVLPGRDPARAGQFVSLGAHYDHDGIGPVVDGDSIYNGADDNGSGTVALMEVAERLAHLPAAERPARSVLFVWHTAEEKGLLGAEHFTDRPTVPRDSIVVNFNADMVGRNHPDSLNVIGSRRLSTELGDRLEAVNARQPQPFVLDYTFDARDHPERLYCRSDHWMYARYGIPVVFLTTGLHDQYHQPSDRVELIEFDKLSRVSKLLADLTLDVANAADRPAVDQPVPPLGAPCT